MEGVVGLKLVPLSGFSPCPVPETAASVNTNYLRIVCPLSCVPLAGYRRNRNYPPRLPHPHPHPYTPPLVGWMEPMVSKVSCSLFSVKAGVSQNVAFYASPADRTSTHPRLPNLCLLRVFDFIQFSRTFSNIKVGIRYKH